MAPPPPAPPPPLKGSHAPDPVAASDMQRVQQLAKLITESLRDKAGQPLFSLIGPNHEHVQLPADVLTLLQQLLAILAAGDSVSIVPIHRELTTQEAANILNVSRQYLVQLLDERKIPFHRTGTHRRIFSKDILEYRSKRKEERRAKLAAMAQETQEAGGYPELDP